MFACVAWYKHQRKATHVYTFRFQLYEDVEITIAASRAPGSYPTGVQEVSWICSIDLYFLKGCPRALFEFVFELHMVVTTEGSAASSFTRGLEKRQSPACAKD